MALVRRPTAVGRASVPVVAHAPVIPHQGSPGSPAAAPAPAPTQYSGEEAAAAPTMPAEPWAVVTGFGLVAAGGLGAMTLNTWHPQTVFQVGSQMSAFAALFVFAAAVERLLEPVSRWMPGRSTQASYERAYADMSNGVPGAIQAVAHYKAANERARSSRGVLMWGIATAVATVLSAGGGFYLLRMISANPTWAAVPTWVDALVTGLVVGSGTKPLHDLIAKVQKQKENAADFG